MKRFISMMLVLAFAVVLVAGCGGTPEDKLAKATDELAAGNFDKAISICEDLLKDEDLDAALKTQVDALLKSAEAKKKVDELLPS
jgi:hypothetical protein